jgi:hypothetical protein
MEWGKKRFSAGKAELEGTIFGPREYPQAVASTCEVFGAALNRE